jgi:ABC-type Fe3+-hydroxamate transport system substrate-binding protein
MLKLFALLALAGALAAAGSSAFAAGPQTITGTDGPGFTITLKQHSRNVLSLPPATYLFVIHNFHLIGPGVNKKTSVAAVGKTTWRLTLRRGTYRFICDPHATIMKGKFVVKAP